MKTENKIINIGAVCDKQLIDRLDAIANGYAVAYAEECGFEGYTDGGIYGRGYLRIRIYRVPPKA